MRSLPSRFYNSLGFLAAVAVCAVPFIPAIAASPQNDRAGQSKEAQERQIVLLKAEVLPKNAIKLRLERTISDEDLKAKGLFFQQLADLNIDRGRIYVSDLRQHKVLVFDTGGSFIRAIGQKGQGPGEFISPLNIFCDAEGSLFVNNMGNGRIDIFNEDGEYLRSFKKYKTYKNMIIGNNGLIYANYASSKLDEENIIEVINNRGELILSFGKRIRFRGNSIAHNEVRLALAENKYLYAVWASFNVLRKYSLDGSLLKETKIKDQTVQAISDDNDRRMIPVDGKVTGRGLFYGFCYSGGKLYLLKVFPRIEILECDDNGNVGKTYWTDIPYDYIGGNLAIAEIDGEMKAITLQKYPENRIAFYTNLSK